MEAARSVPDRASLSFALRRTLRALETVTADGWPASVREIQAEAGYGSTSTAHTNLYALERRGFAEKHPRRDAGGWLPVGR